MNRMFLLIKKLVYVLSLGVFLMSPAAEKEELLTPKVKALRELVEVMIHPRMVKSLRQEFLVKIRSGLTMSNRSIFEELLAESESSNKGKLISEYEKIERKMNKDLVTDFDSKVDMRKILIEIHEEIYKNSFTRYEIEKILEFMKSPVGKKYLRLSRKITEQIQQKAVERLYPLAMDVSATSQDELRKSVMQLFQDDVDSEME